MSNLGSGKSSLIHGILGEMALGSGSVHLDAKLAYAPQTAFTLNTTVRENILFGLPFVKADYDACVDACALKSDLEQLPTGDLSQIGAMYRMICIIFLSGSSSLKQYILYSI